MGTVTVTVDPTGLAILQRLHAVLHPIVEVGWPALRNTDGTPTGDLLAAHTIVVDDHRIGVKEQAILDAVLASPQRLPDPLPDGFDHEALLALYPEWPTLIPKEQL